MYIWYLSIHRTMNICLQYFWLTKGNCTKLPMLSTYAQGTTVWICQVYQWRQGVISFSFPSNLWEVPAMCITEIENMIIPLAFSYLVCRQNNIWKMNADASWKLPNSSRIKVESHVKTCKWGPTVLQTYSFIQVPNIEIYQQKISKKTNFHL